MTPQEKAEELVNKFRPMMYCYVGSEMLTNTFNEQEQIRNAKQCALICVEDLIKYTASINSMPPNCQSINEYCREYWQEVKQETEKL